MSPDPPYPSRSIWQGFRSTNNPVQLRARGRTPSQCGVVDLLHRMQEIEPTFAGHELSFLQQNRIPQQARGVFIEQNDAAPSFLIWRGHDIYAHTIPKGRHWRSEYLKYAEHREYPDDAFPVLMFDFQTCAMYSVQKHLGRDGKVVVQKRKVPDPRG